MAFDGTQVKNIEKVIARLYEECFCGGKR